MKIKAIIVEPGKEPYTKIIDSSTFQAAREIIGCRWIEVVRPFPDPVAILCDEEGKLDEKPLNRALYDGEKVFDVIVGTFLIVGVDDNAEDFVSLSDELVDKYVARFAYPEIFIKAGGKIIAFPIQ